MMKKLSPNSRRDFLSLSASTVGAFVVAETLGNFNYLQASSVDKSGKQSPYGPLKPTKDMNTGLELLSLPEGFKYITGNWKGQPWFHLR